MNEPSKCLKKVYQTRAEAKKTMKQNNKHYRWHLTDVYWCEPCSGYHTTSIGKERSRNMKKSKP